MLLRIEIAIALILAAIIIGFGSGYAVRSKICKGDDAKAQAALVQRQLDARQAAEKSDDKLVPQQEKELSDFEDKTHDLPNKISPGECFSANDVDWLRNNVWGGKK